MRIIKKLLPLTLLIFTACKEPPDVAPCLLKIQKRTVTLIDNTPLEIIDLEKSKGFCNPVMPQKPEYEVKIEDLDKSYAYSNADNARLKKWIVDNSQ